MKVYIFTNEKLVLATDAREIILPTPDGLLGVLENHIPFVTGLGAGIMLLKDKANVWSSFAVWRGTAYVEKNFTFSKEIRKIVELPKYNETFVLVLGLGIDAAKNLDKDMVKSEFDDALVALAGATTAEAKLRKSWEAKRCQVRFAATKTLPLDVTLGYKINK
jgi:hypothetical protein